MPTEKLTTGHLIRQERRKALYTMKALARSLGVHRNTIRNWEKGITCPTVDELGRVAKVLECSYYHLVPSPDVSITITIREKS